MTLSQLLRSVAIACLSLGVVLARVDVLVDAAAGRRAEASATPSAAGAGDDLSLYTMPAGSDGVVSDYVIEVGVAYDTVAVADDAAVLELVSGDTCLDHCRQEPTCVGVLYHPKETGAEHAGRCLLQRLMLRREVAIPAPTAPQWTRFVVAAASLSHNTGWTSSPSSKQPGTALPGSPYEQKHSIECATSCVQQPDVCVGFTFQTGLPMASNLHDTKSWCTLFSAMDMDQPLQPNFQSSTFVRLRDADNVYFELRPWSHLPNASVVLHMVSASRCQQHCLSTSTVTDSATRCTAFTYLEQSDQHTCYTFTSNDVRSLADTMTMLPSIDTDPTADVDAVAFARSEQLGPAVSGFVVNNTTWKFMPSTMIVSSTGALSGESEADVGSGVASGVGFDILYDSDGFHCQQSCMSDAACTSYTYVRMGPSVGECHRLNTTYAVMRAHASMVPNFQTVSAVKLSVIANEDGSGAVDSDEPKPDPPPDTPSSNNDSHVTVVVIVVVLLVLMGFVAGLLYRKRRSQFAIDHSSVGIQALAQ